MASALLPYWKGRKALTSWKLLPFYRQMIRISRTFPWTLTSLHTTSNRINNYNSYTHSNQTTSRQWHTQPLQDLKTLSATEQWDFKTGAFICPNNCCNQSQLGTTTYRVIQALTACKELSPSISTVPDTRTMLHNLFPTVKIVKSTSSTVQAKENSHQRISLLTLGMK